MTSRKREIWFFNRLCIALAFTATLLTPIWLFAQSAPDLDQVIQKLTDDNAAICEKLDLADKTANTILDLELKILHKKLELNAASSKCDPITKNIPSAELKTSTMNAAAGKLIDLLTKRDGGSVFVRLFNKGEALLRHKNSKAQKDPEELIDLACDLDAATSAGGVIPGALKDDGDTFTFKGLWLSTNFKDLDPNLDIDAMTLITFSGKYQGEKKETKLSALTSMTLEMHDFDDADKKVECTFKFYLKGAGLDPRPGPGQPDPAKPGEAELPDCDPKKCKCKKGECPTPDGEEAKAEEAKTPPAKKKKGCSVDSTGNPLSLLMLILPLLWLPIRKRVLVRK